MVLGVVSGLDGCSGGAVVNTDMVLDAIREEVSLLSMVDVSGVVDAVDTAIVVDCVIMSKKVYKVYSRVHI